MASRKSATRKNARGTRSAKSAKRATTAKTKTAKTAKAATAAATGDASTIIYVHGIGNKPAASVLKAQWDQALLKELSQAMVDASICGLGQAAPNPALSVMKYFPREIE